MVVHLTDFFEVEVCGGSNGLGMFGMLGGRETKFEIDKILVAV